MRTIILVSVLILATIAANAEAQTGPPHTTETVTGPVFVSPGGQATFDVAIDVDGAESTLVITWSVAGTGESCCDLVESSVVSGQATSQPAQYGSQRWIVSGPHANIRMTLALFNTVTSGQIIVAGYLPGTDVAKYQTINGWKSIVGTPLPLSGGQPSGARSDAGNRMIGAGVAVLLLSGACFVAASTSRRRSA